MKDLNSDQPQSGARSALLLLLAINLFNYIDRQVLSAVLPKMMLDPTIFDPSDKWLQAKAGALTTAFMFSYMLLSPIFGPLGDRWSRWKIIGCAMCIWSLASGFSGFALSFWMLLALRCVVGIGEAAYGPIAPAMISDLYPTSKRGKVMSWFYLAIPVGSALGFVVGGQVEKITGHWQYSFYVTFLGILLSLLCFFMLEPSRQSIKQETQKQNYYEVLKSLIRIRSFVLCCLGMTCTTFMLGGVAVFVPTYIFQREARFALNSEAVSKLGSLENNAHQPLIAPEVLAKLRNHQRENERSSTEMREELKTILTEEELKNYNLLIFENVATPKSISNGQVTLYFGVITVLMGLIATILGGLAGDWLRARQVRGAYFHVAGWSTILAWPFFAGFLFTPFPAAWAVLAVAVFLLFFNTGPANTIIANVVSSRIRATAFAINILVIHALGDAISPAIIGLISDYSNLHTAFLITSLMIPAGGILWVMGARYLDADTERATVS